jgi:hypothetical protein
MERFHAESNDQNDTDSGTPSDPLSPLGVLLLASEAITPSPVTLLPSVEAAAESPLVNAFKAPCYKTDASVHLSVSITPVSIVHHTFNVNYENVEDFDGEIEPFYDAVEGEDLLDSDDDNDWDDPIPSDPRNAEPSDANNNPTNIPAEADEPPLEMTEQQLMLLSNAALREELRKRNQSTNGNKSVMVQRLLIGVKKCVPGNRKDQEQYKRRRRC